MTLIVDYHKFGYSIVLRHWSRGQRVGGIGVEWS